MKKIVLLLLGFSAFRGNAQMEIDVLRYTFRIELNDNNDTIYGEAAIHFIRQKGSKIIRFDLANQSSKGSGMKVQSVKHLLASSRQVELGKSQFSHANNTLTIIADEKSFRGDTGFYVIQYKGIPADGLIISRNKYGRRTFFADNWPNRGHNWLPCHDDPADKAAVEFIVSAPQHYQVVANGLQVEETNLANDKKRTHWKEDVPISTKVMVIGVADFAVNLSGMVNDCIPVYSWVYPEDRDNGFYDYSLAVDILPWFIKNVGPYGYKKLANVQSKTTFGGLENANTIFYAESSVTGTQSKEALIVHEIAHQWFGNMATEKKFAHLWLSEGFATYMTILYMEQKYGKDTAIAMLKEDRDQVVAFAKTSKRPVVDVTPDYMDLLNANSYQKGGWVLHMLRRELGEDLFWTGIRKYYSTYAGSTAGTDDFRKIMEDVSGKNLQAFFNQWLYTPGIPVVDVSWTYIAAEKKVAITIEQVQATPFSFPLEVQLSSTGANAKVEKLDIKQKKETFYIPFDGVVSAVKTDINTSLLFEQVPLRNR